MTKILIKFGGVSFLFKKKNKINNIQYYFYSLLIKLKFRAILLLKIFILKIVLHLLKFELFGFIIFFFFLKINYIRTLKQIFMLLSSF